MLLSVDTTEIEHRCETCAARRRIPLAGLVAGVERGTPDIIALPACGHCRSREFLNRTAPRAGGAGELARAVNALHAALVAAGNAAGSHRERLAADGREFERAALPWAYPGDPPAPAGRGRAPTLVVRRAREE